jgi:hypothetical protein
MFRATHGLQSMFQIKRDRASASPARRHGQLEAWRAAASAVWTRWDALLTSPPERRARAFAAYTAALDAEAAAAEEMATTTAARA